MTILVTGGAGFIGSNFVRDWLSHVDEIVVNLDKLTYAGNPANLDGVQKAGNHVFVHGDIGDRDLIRPLLRQYEPRAIVNFAAESHVDRSIHGPAEFIQTNLVGTFTLLEESRIWWQSMPGQTRDAFRFLHVSTDEVYGSLEADDAPFTEDSSYAPNSPYSATKAGSDHLVRAYHHTFGLPTLTTNCSNNYGPYQFPEKLIPLMILNAVRGKPLPVYGDGQNIRDWLFVVDHCRAIRRVLEAGRVGTVYNIGGECERTNLDVVRAVCGILDRLQPRKSELHDGLITYVRDRPGHDRRYAVDTSRISKELGWRPAESFESGLEKTVRWYLANSSWISKVESGEYRQWLDQNYAKRTK